MKRSQTELPSIIQGVRMFDVFWDFTEDERKDAIAAAKAEFPGECFELTKTGFKLRVTQKVKTEIKFERQTQEEKQEFGAETAIATKKKKKLA